MAGLQIGLTFLRLEQWFLTRDTFAPLPPRHLATSETFMVVITGGGVLHISSRWDPQMLLSILKCIDYIPLPKAKNYLIQNDKSAEVEKPWSRTQHGSVLCAKTNPEVQGQKDTK